MSETSASLPTIAFPEDQQATIQYVLRFLLVGGLRVDVTFPDGATRPGYAHNLVFDRGTTTLLAEVVVDSAEPGQEPALIKVFIDLEGEVTAVVST